MRCLALILTLALAGCKSGGDIKPPEIVYVTVDRYVALPPALVAPCPATAKRDNSVGEAVRLANARLADVKACDARMTEIRKLQPEESRDP